MASKRTRIEADSPNESSWRVLLIGRKSRVFPTKENGLLLRVGSSPASWITRLSDQSSNSCGQPHGVKLPAGLRRRFQEPSQSKSVYQRCRPLLGCADRPHYFVKYAECVSRGRRPEGRWSFVSLRNVLASPSEVVKLCRSR